MKPKLLTLLLISALMASPAATVAQKHKQRKARTTQTAKQSTRKSKSTAKATTKKRPKTKTNKSEQSDGKTFTAAEQQQISIATPGLFAKQSTLRIDFTQPVGYSFPMPVGQARVVDNQSLEITSTQGDIVLAMFDGTVRLSRHLPQFGNVVVVRHDNGLETVYGHNSRNLVKVGQRVKAGQRVAIVGDEGGRCYCLFSIMVNGGRINPTTLLAPKSHQLLRQVVVISKVGNRVSVQTEGAAQEQREVAAKAEAKGKSGKITSLDPDDEDDQLLARNPTFKLDLKGIADEHWSYPLQGAHVISPYGGRGRRKHAGVDIKTRPNDKVLAAFDGVVTQSGPYYGYGNYIVIRHAYGFSTCYSHQSRNYVKKGQKVKAGEVIGLTGRTGRATTEHLHFEVRFKGRTINPAMLFDHVNHKLQAKVLTIGKSSIK